MQQLSPRDYDRVLVAVGELHSCARLSEFPALLLEVCSRLIPNDLAAYTEIDLAEGTPLSIMNDSDGAEMAARLEPAWLSYWHSHPLVIYHRSCGAPEVRSIDDFMPLRQWREEPLYREFYRHLDGVRHMVIPVPKRPGLEIGVAFNRASRRFSERDRLIGTLLQEHLSVVHQRLTELARLESQLAQWEHAANSLGLLLILIDRDGKVLQSHGNSHERLSMYCNGTAARLLHGDLWNWARSQIKLIHDRNCPSSLPERMVTSRGGCTLTLTLHADRQPGQYLIVGRERRRSDPARLCQLGLTLRQSEILWNVSQGMTNQDIGQALRISPRTVQKHLERIFVKLGVSTRTEAARQAANVGAI